MLEKYFRKILFRRFLKIDLNAVELAAAEDSLKNKYSKGLLESLIYGLISIPALLFLAAHVSARIEPVYIPQIACCVVI